MKKSDDNMNKREVNILSLIVFLFIITLVVGLTYQNNITGRFGEITPPGSEAEGQTLCSSNADCNDNNACTTDTCNSGTCSRTEVTLCCGNSLCESGEGCSCSDCEGKQNGCGPGYVCSSGTCKAVQLKCPDGTVYGVCSSTKPRYCSNGVLINACGTCGCSTGYACKSDGTCVIPVCSANSQCNDNNACTTDTCVNAGLATSYCSNPAPATCCGNNVKESGENCGTCPSDSPCSQGYTCSNNACVKISCSANSQCNDNNACTTDTCNNPGAATSYCSNPATAPCCGNNVKESGENCGTCPNDSPCSQGYTCSNNACTQIKCTSNLQCNDNNACTTDTCNNPGAATASCSYTTVSNCCGNNIIETGEQCEDTQLGGKTCQTQGYSSGTLSCKADCTYDTSQCILTQTAEGEGQPTTCLDGTALGSCNAQGKYCTQDELGNLVLTFDCRYCNYKCATGYVCSTGPDGDGGCYTCQETDAGDPEEYYKKSLVKGKFFEQDYSESDSCADSKTLVEYLCKGGIPYLDEINCPYGCSNGACNKPSLPLSPTGPPISTGPSSSTTPECNDNLDNDEDGLKDLDDPGCIDTDDNDEVDEEIIEAPECSDGIDNDDDGLIDLQDDTGCASPEDDSESEEITEAGECEDSDKGKNYFSRGTTSKNELSFTDYCIDSETLKEGLCSNNEITSEVYDCPDTLVCRRGACEEKTTNVLDALVLALKSLLSAFF